MRNPPRIDLCDTPAPRIDLLNTEAYRVGCVQTTRGCPFSCEFCDIIVTYGRKVRTKPIKNVINTGSQTRRRSGIDLR